MDIQDPVEDAVELLQQLGLKEYEARCFVALSQISAGTAKEVAAIADVPKTRVYDSVRVLEARGLAEVQHASPRRFRAVRTDEAVSTLRSQYENRIDRLTEALDRSRDGRPDPVSEAQEVWSLVGKEAIRSRVDRMIADADDRVVVIAGHEDRVTEDFLSPLGGVDGPDVVVRVPTDRAERRVREHAPRVEVSVSAFDWAGAGADADGAAIGTLLLADGSCVLVSTVLPRGEERAVIGTARHNGLVVLVRRLIELSIDR
ncbi:MULTISPECIES: TrmB family transcriptional regulator [Halolamina]|uniref:Sugar-specific transcriptional regulator TrmB n=1 Tax=Halolamina pelagica TaxID=699431 RepID=A0A1I5Q944_9EURY|nr:MULTISPECIES: helix-turn-helix domain-containing protein [Halolamina]NHX35160.1 TrmB family transcriptional regulator [Halolamina sp. R1-12]SFP42858.1 Sugar-specific transcriptional regulator TrmB [Halolamina pelagica]